MEKVIGDWKIMNFEWVAGFQAIYVVICRPEDLILPINISSKELMKKQIEFKRIVFLSRVITENNHKWYREVYCTQRNCKFTIEADKVTKDSLYHCCTENFSGMK